MRCHFVFAGPIQLCTETHVVPRYLVSGEKYAVHGFTVSTRVEHAQVVLAQRKQNGRVPVPKNRMSITTNLVLLTFILRPTVF